MLRKVRRGLAMSVILCLSGSVLAGHTRPSGEECNCGCIGCFCDPGEPPICQNANRAGSDILGGVSGDKSAATPESSGDGGAVLFGALVFMAILRSLWR
jgi:hypothetical protein